MSGIVGMVNGHAVARDLVSALSRLDERGYDSSGLVVAGPGFAVRKVAGPASMLASNLAGADFAGRAGIANARWAGHDRPEAHSAPPIVWGGVAIVHSGVIENHQALRRELKALGHAFDTEADGEVIPHLIAAARTAGATPDAALRAACTRMRGGFAIAALFMEAPDRVLVACHGSPMVVARGACGVAAASDAVVLMALADDCATLEYGDTAELGGAGVRILDRNGEAAERPWRPLGVHAEAAQAPASDRFVHHARREIAAQPETLRQTDAALRGLVLPAAIAAPERLHIVAAGSSLHAAAAARGWVEQFCGLPCDVQPAGKWRDRPIALAGGTLGVLVSRSGEHRDVLAALQGLRARGVATVAVTNAPHSSLARGADLSWPTMAGPEFGVAASKSFTAHLLALLRLARALGAARGALGGADARQVDRALADAPLACALAEAAEARFAAIGARIGRAGAVIVIGRGWGAGLAAEAAAQVRRLAHVHAEAVPHGDLGDAPLAGLPSLVLASADRHLAPTTVAAEAVRGRGGHVIALAEAACSARLDHVAHEVVALPGRGLAQMFAQAVALQLIAYHTALALGRDVDRPHGLAA